LKERTLTAALLEGKRLNGAQRAAIENTAAAVP
jgi:hypothetical protein